MTSPCAFKIPFSLRRHRKSWSFASPIFGFPYIFSPFCTSSQSFQDCQKSDYSHVNWDVIEKRFEEQKCLLVGRKSRTCPKAKAIISKCNFLFREYPKQSYSFYKCNFYSRLLEYMTHILSAKIPHFNLKFQCLCMQCKHKRKRRKKEILWDGHFFLSIKKFISRCIFI